MLYKLKGFAPFVYTIDLELKVEEKRWPSSFHLSPPYNWPLLDMFSRQ